MLPLRHGRTVVALLGVIVLVAAVAPTGAAAADVDASQHGLQADVQESTPTDNESGTESDATPTPTPDSSSSSDGDEKPGTASSVRITPVTFDEDWLDVKTVDADETYNTSGPFVVFTLSAPAENVRISQSGADARLFEGSQTVRVTYDDDAAPTSGQSYFQLELFFEDGSSTTVDLYAEQTAVSAAAMEYEAYSDLIDDMQDDAVDRGFKETPEGLQNFYEWQVERVELIESFLVERAAQLFGAAVLLARNPLAWVLALVAIAVIAYKREQAHGWILDRIENDAGETARKQEQMKAAYREHQKAANEEYIGELNEVNDQQAVYWRDAFDVWSVHQLAELARQGPDDLDREAVADGGDETVSAVGAVDPSDVHDSWLASVFSTNRLSSPQEALSQMRASLIRMEATYGMGHIYGETRSDVEALLEAVRQAEGGL